MLTACGGTGNTRENEGANPTGTVRPGTVYSTSDAIIVHVNVNGRIATIRNGNNFEEGAFLIAKDRSGEQTGVLKALPLRPGLRTADILEGEPMINDVVSPAGTSESERLAKIYRDPEQE